MLGHCLNNIGSCISLNGQEDIKEERRGDLRLCYSVASLYWTYVILPRSRKGLTSTGLRWMIWLEIYIQQFSFSLWLYL